MQLTSFSFSAIATNEKLTWQGETTPLQSPAQPQLLTVCMTLLEIVTAKSKKQKQKQKRFKVRESSSANGSRSRQIQKR